jgi:hypothetical protein
MLDQHVIQAPNFPHSWHENKDSRRIDTIFRVFEADSLQQAYNELVWDKPFVQKVNRGSRFGRVPLLQLDILMYRIFLVVISGRDVL